MTPSLSLSPLGLPGQLLGLLGNVLSSHGSKSSKGSSSATAGYVGGFGSALGAALSSGTGLDARLTALVKSGTPISKIVNVLANRIADSLARLLPSSQLGSGALRTSLIDSLQTALSPPSNAPPGSSAASQVAALVQRLQTWIEGVANEAEHAGQQNDIAGNLLDANSAKDIPARHQQPDAPSTSSPLDAATSPALLAASLTQSLLASTAAELGAPASVRASASKRTSSDPAAAASAVVAASARATLAGGAADPSSSGNVATLSANPSTPTGAAAPGSTTNAPADLLARMLARAAGVDLRTNPIVRNAPGKPVVASTNDTALPAHAEAVASATTQPSASAVALETVPAANAAQAASQANGEPGGAGTTTPSASSFLAAAKLSALLDSAIASAAQGGGADSATTGGRWNDPTSLDVATATTSKTTTQPSTASAFALPSTPAPTLPSSPASAAANGYAGASFDPAALESLVRSMALRTGNDGSSELRMRLQPESLGSVTLRLTVSGNNVSASMVAQNADSRLALLASQQQLARSLAGAGLRLTGFSVNLSGGDTGREQPRDRTNGFGRRYVVHEVGGIAASGSSESTDIGPAIAPESTIGLLSYLV